MSRSIVGIRECPQEPPSLAAERLARRLAVAASMMEANPLFPRGQARTDLIAELRAISSAVRAALAAHRQENERG